MAERSVVIRLKGEIGDFRAKMMQANASVGQTVATMGQASREGAQMRSSFSTVAGAAGKMGLAAAAGLAYVTKSAMDWESAWAGVTKTVDGSAAEMGVLEDQLRELARTLPATHTEIAGVAEAAGQLGIARQDVAQFTETMVALGETTNLSAEEAATSIARFSNIMGTSSDEVERIGSTLVDLGNNSATTEAEILTLGQRLAAAGAIAGIAESDVLAFASTLTSVGVEAEAGGTALSKVFTSVRDAALDGGEKLEAFAEVAGVSAEGFRAAFEDDAAGAVEMFISGLGRMNEAGESTTGVFKELGLTDQRLMRALLSTASAGDLLSDSLELGGEAWEDNTALAIEAAKRYETSASQMQVSFNNIKDAAIDFGEVALPILAGAAEGVAGFAQAVGSLPGPVKTAGTSLLGITAVLGGGMWFTSKAINGVVEMKGALKNLGLGADGATKAIKGVGVAAAVLAGISIGDSLQRQFDNALPGAEALMKQMIELAQSGDADALASEFDSLDDSIARLTDRNWAQKLQDSIYSKAGFLGSDSSVDEATAQIEALDAELARMVSSGSAETAAMFLDQLAESGRISSAELDAMRPLLVNYDEALDGVKNSAELAGGAASGAVPGFEDVGGAAGEAGEEVDGFSDALERLDAVLEGRSEMRDYQQSLIDFEDAMKERKGLQEDLAEAQSDLATAETPEERDAARERIAGLKEELADYALTLDTSTQAGIDWEQRLDNLAETAAVAAENLTGMDRKKYLRSARRDFIDAATDLGKTKRQARLLWEELLQLDEADVNIDISATTTANIPKLLGPSFDFGGPRALGGPVGANKTYLVGENGPELLRMGSSSGYVEPNFASRPAPSAPFDPAAMAQQMAGMTAPLIGQATFLARDMDDIERRATDMQRQRAVGGTGGGRRR